MLDDPEKTSRLLAELKAAVPFGVELTPLLVRHLRSQRTIISETAHTVLDLSYAGDEGGIVCHIAPSGTDGALVVSLTHVVVPHRMPLAAAVRQYQKHRIKKLKKQGQV
jgi:hypothetical protein